MIQAMKKLYLVVHNDAIAATIDSLQDKGAVHLMRGEIAQGTIAELVSQKNRLEAFIKYLSKNKQEVSKSKTSNVYDILKKYEELLEKIQDIKNMLSKVKKECTQALSWGDFDKSLLEKIRAKGFLKLTFFEAPTKAFSKIKETDLLFYVVSSNPSKTFFVVLEKGESAKDSLEIVKEFAETVNLPERSYIECNKEITSFEEEVKILESKSEELIKYKEEAIDELKRVTDELSRKEAVLSLKDHYGKVSTIAGFFPSSRESEMVKFLNDQKDIVYRIEDPSFDDNVPVLLKNGRFARLFEPITKLFALPEYMELDLTPFFAPFFAMFFGLCLGDAGYGLVLFIAMTISFFKFKKARPIIVFGMVLSASTILFGLLTGTTFGIDLFKTKLPILSSLAYFKSDHLFYLALMLGLLQILVGMVLQSVNRFINRGFFPALSVFGWVFLAFFGTAAFLDSYLKGNLPSGDFALGIAFAKFCIELPSFMVKGGIIVGLLLVLFFNDMRIKFHFRVLKGLWDLYGIITGFVGDLLSYIRLFALGVSSAILGTVINSIALQLLDIKVPILSHVLFLLFIVVGHSGNLLLAALGSFVHPLRLTFVEFYKNAGFMGGAKGYTPLKRVYVKTK